MSDSRDVYVVTDDSSDDIVAIVTSEELVAECVAVMEEATDSTYSWEHYPNKFFAEDVSKVEVIYSLLWSPNFDHKMNNSAEYSIDEVEVVLNPVGAALPDDILDESKWRTVFGRSPEEVLEKVKGLRASFLKKSNVKVDRTDRPGRRSPTEDDFLDMEAEFYTKIDREFFAKVFEEGGNAYLLNQGRTWGWDDTEVRESLGEELVKVGGTEMQLAMGLVAPEDVLKRISQ